MVEGMVLGGRYRLEGLLGKGAMGQVWRASDLVLPRQVAIKLMSAFRELEEGVKERFVVEAQVGAAVRHPNLTVVHDLGDHGEQQFIVMELLDGRDLGEVIAGERGGLPLDDVLELGIQVANGLAAAHRRGVVHRDVKPSNIMILEGGWAKICDFGIARVLEDGPVEGTHQIGSPPYLAPEQFEGKVDARADLYSLGCVVYEMCLGERPFIGNRIQLAFQHRNKEPSRLRERRPEIPEALEEIVIRLMAKDPELRPQKAEGIAAELRRIRDERKGLRQRLEVRPVRRGVDPVVENRRTYEPASKGLLRAGTPFRARTAENDRVAQRLREILVSFGIDATVGMFARGPAVTRYEVRLGPTATVERLGELTSHIERSLGTAVTFLPKVPSTASLPDIAAVGYEIVNSDRDFVSVGGVLWDATQDISSFAIALGRDRSGSTVADLRTLPHLLIAGRNKKDVGSVVDAVLVSLLTNAAPDDLCLVLTDPVYSGLARYEGVPHLHQSVALGTADTIDVLREVEREMELRYDEMAAAGCRTLDAYNAAVRRGEILASASRFGRGNAPGHPRLAVVVAELAAPMGVAVNEFGGSLTNLSRLGRAAGVHLIIATTTIDEPTLPRSIRSQLPVRLVMATGTAAESELLLGTAGAEKLLDRGDALYRRRGDAETARVQCAVPAPEELEAVLGHWRGQG
ncbi:hypothetical protein GCM10009550_35780 [Actinocorallia libanotica]|uniref:Non-specific serine/threonine protein kinase n=1 Tax=Actinocorallia libanotica TaxID=46162 RepID=A0ABP4BQR7_9ACTN